MLIIIGFVVVAGSVLGGYMLEGGHVLLLAQPAEFLIIGGAAIGNILISTPPPVLRRMLAQIRGTFKPSWGRTEFLDLLAMMYQLFRTVQQTGVMALEPHFDDPAKSPILSQFPKFLALEHSVAFLADSMKVIIVGGISAHDLELLMDEDLEVSHAETSRPSGTLVRIADALPGLGIVAAVLGVVLTMQAIDGPPSEIGEKVGAALVGTFIGILLSYGFVNPLAISLEQRALQDGLVAQCMKAGVLSMYKGAPPAIAVEFARRVLPEDVRPGFEETEKRCRASRAEAKAA